MNILIYRLYRPLRVVLLSILHSSVFAMCKVLLSNWTAFLHFQRIHLPNSFFHVFIFHVNFIYSDLISHNILRHLLYRIFPIVRGLDELQMYFIVLCLILSDLFWLVSSLSWICVCLAGQATWFVWYYKYWHKCQSNDASFIWSFQLCLFNYDIF